LKLRLAFLEFLIVWSTTSLLAQTIDISGKKSSTTGYYSPAGIFENILDQNGRTYGLSELLISRPTRSLLFGNDSVNEPQTALTFTSCNTGYFKLYFETGCGMEGNTPQEISRRDVLCQVFSDLSQFIISPLSSNGGKVNILVRSINNMGISAPSVSGTLGLGTTFFSIPAVQNIGGIADNMTWQTIVSGQDSYINIIVVRLKFNENGVI